MLKDKIDDRIDIKPKVWFGRVFLTACLIANQNFSTGFKSGEHGSKTKFYIQRFLLIFSSLSDL
ncbi:hypothetical protein [Wolbachia endosymbiont of Brugia pahangi]|uniref:hypothetical protein n=1 Tax=Wolbachia endosymbiont of Brugia pahangi TaxID=96495 RepID=UPI001439891A|nr:hypothetical protein [Wolbachia endosymbiont of Brugia pahangi]